jgi:hypothetical protein
MNLYFNSMEKNYLIYFKLFLTFVIFFNCGELFSQTNTDTIPGTYPIQVPAGVTSLQAAAWGSGSGKTLLNYNYPTNSLTNTAAQATSPNTSSLIAVTGITSALPVGGT